MPFGYARRAPGTVQIAVDCASESQNRSVVAAAVLRMAVLNHTVIALATLWFGLHPRGSNRLTGGYDRAETAPAKQSRPSTDSYIASWQSKLAIYITIS